MQLTVLYPLTELISIQTTLTPVTRYHMITGVPDTFDVSKTDISLHLASGNHTYHDVLHTETPRMYKPTIDRVWPFFDDCRIEQQLSDLDLLLIHPEQYPNYNIDQSQHNLDLLHDFVDIAYVCHDDKSYIDTLSPNRCGYNAIEDSINTFSTFLSVNFNVPIQDSKFIIESV